ncbi:hypothetical protein [Rhodohalobacter barkolensis]|uniref:Uncharacterized protein n=1 Tax=Rhodohalobacter barkolensis TaxID=2053187 RepID=A0A2N0VF24_9BACT|nr:hypothetical protein [Rhodohalobacter barkolensis]PKD42792.1 hypothetical protein CWD77_13135 [Rhodohalobacter barkolensis]
MKTINQVNGFSKERFLQVVKRFWVLNQKKWLIGFAGGIGILVLIYLLNSTGPTANVNSGIAVVGVGLTLYKFGGYFLTSGIFDELGKKSSASQMLTLPASTFEKFLAGWFLTYFLYTFVVVGLLYLIGIILGVNPVLTSLQLSDPNVDASKAYFLDALLSYTALHSVFFLGSTFFKGNNFLKTLLSIVLFFIAIGLIALVIQIIFPGEVTETVFFPTLMGISKTMVLWIGTLFKIGTAALFLFLSYRQLQNRQIA